MQKYTKVSDSVPGGQQSNRACTSDGSARTDDSVENSRYRTALTSSVGSSQERLDVKPPLADVAVLFPTREADRHINSVASLKYLRSS